MLPYLVFLKKAQYRCLDIRDMSYSCMLLSWSSAGFPRSASKTFVIKSEILILILSKHIQLTTFFGFQVAIFSYVVLRTFTNTSPSIDPRNNQNVVSSLGVSKLRIVLMLQNCIRLSFFFRVMMECSVNNALVLMGQSQLFALTKQMDALLLGYRI